MQTTRRQALSAGAVAGLSLLTGACTRTPPPQLPPAVKDPQAVSDEALRREAVAREQELVQAYAAALHAHPKLTALLAPLLGDHAAHLAALGPAPETSAGAGEGAEKVSLRRLAAKERAAASAYAQAALTASRELAPLLASLAACEASHVAVL